MILLDTHVWVRWLLPSDPLPALLIDRIEGDRQACISAISCWEVAMLVARRRIDIPFSAKEWITEATMGSGIEIIPINCETARLAADLPRHHRDPADRIIIATAQYLNIPLLSMDECFPAYFAKPGSLIQG